MNKNNFKLISHQISTNALSKIKHNYNAFIANLLIEKLNAYNDEEKEYIIKKAFSKDNF